MPAPKITSVQVRRGIRAEWVAANPQLLDGEIGFETDTYRIKVGRRDSLGKLINWNDLRYQAPFSGLEKPNYPQDGDFWVQDSTKDLYYFDGQVWRRILGTNENGDIIIDGNLNMENGCVTGDLLPCKDVTFNLGSPEKRWNEIHLGDSVSETDFVINVGESTDETNVLGGYYRLQLNGDDIAVRKDFENLDTRNVSLWRTTAEDGSPNPIPSEYYEFVNGDSRNLPPQNNISSQAQYNEWVLASLLKIVGRESTPGEQTQQYWNNSSFELTLNAQKGVVTPIQGNETDYENAGLPSQYFHKADGSVSDRVPLNQSYWVDVPRLNNTRR